MSMSHNREQLELPALEGADRVVGVWLSALAECRARTLALVEDIDVSYVDLDHPLTGNSIGTLLYHIAVIEADWLYVEVRGEPGFPADVGAMFPFDVRIEGGRLTPVRGVALDAHLERLSNVRRLLVETYAAMNEERFHQMRRLDQYDVSPAWVAHHLLQHEAEHRAEMGMIIGQQQG